MTSISDNFQLVEAHTQIAVSAKANANSYRLSSLKRAYSLEQVLQFACPV